ncbi:MAG: cation:proton antiporter [Candidatus Auribacterota bacterium]
MSGLTFLIMFMILMSLTFIVPVLLRRFHIPAVVSMMLVGIVIGPNMLNLVQRVNNIMGRGYPTEDIYLVLDTLGLLGLIFVMVLAGMEVRLNIIKLERKAVLWLGALTFLMPAVTGYYVYAVFEPGQLIGKLVYASLFASHSIGILFPIIKEFKIVRTRIGVSVLAATIITDIASFILLAICIQMNRHAKPESMLGSISIFDRLPLQDLGLCFFALFGISILAYIVLSMWLIPIVAEKVLSRIHYTNDSRLTFFLVGVLIIVLIGELIGISVVVGAFVAGMAIIRTPSFHDHERLLHQKIEGMSYGFLIPFLFLTIGMKTDLSILFSAWKISAIVAATIIGLVLSKTISGWLAMRLSGFDNKKGICVGLMTTPQLDATLAAASVALHLGMIEAEFFNAIVCLSIFTTIPIPVLLKFLITKWQIRFEQIKDNSLATIEMEII